MNGEEVRTVVLFVPGVERLAPHLVHVLTEAVLIIECPLRTDGCGSRLVSRLSWYRCKCRIFEVNGRHRRGGYLDR